MWDASDAIASCHKADATRIARQVWTVLAAVLAAATTVPREALTAEPAQSLEKADVSAESVIQAWRTIRQMDCARCHGRDHDGLAAPSVLQFVRTQSRERFDRIVLDGDPQRGMPGYGKAPRVADSIDSIYRYFLLRANGAIGRGQPFASPTIQQQPDASESRLPNAGTGAQVQHDHAYSRNGTFPLFTAAGSRSRW